MSNRNENSGVGESLRFEGDFTVLVPRESVWQSLTDPEWMSDCVPGLAYYDRVDDGSFEGMASIELVGGEMRNFPVKVWWREMVVPETGRLSGQTRIDKTAIQWEAAMHLHADAATQTTVNWDATVSLPDATTQLRRLLQPLLMQMVRKALSSFLRSVKRKLEEG